MLPHFVENSVARLALRALLTHKIHTKSMRDVGLAYSLLNAVKYDLILTAYQFWIPVRVYPQVIIVRLLCLDVQCRP
jgi:hypothetical protein